MKYAICGKINPKEIELIKEQLKNYFGARGMDPYFRETTIVSFRYPLTEEDKKFILDILGKDYYLTEIDKILE